MHISYGGTAIASQRDDASAQDDNLWNRTPFETERRSRISVPCFAKMHVSSSGFRGNV
ncbi:hypothetical protein RRSWK_00790 [Rhodopirellula sp. SWK7]|nr:hypothetical protein RRSWK_00790 [Rhodopirellula sp. SWK7]